MLKLHFKSEFNHPMKNSNQIDRATLKTIRLFLKKVIHLVPLQQAILFGSRARGDFEPESDADLALILSGEKGKRVPTLFILADIAFDVLLETGIYIQPVPIWKQEWEHPEAYSNPALLANIEEDGILVKGKL
jgi:predicted nucleotidyltransferase